MNSHDPWLQRLSRDDLQPLHPYESSPWNRLREPTVVLTIIALVLTIVLSSSWHAINFESVYHRLWDGVVQTVAFLTPAKLIFYIDARVNPSPLPARMIAARYGTHEAKSQAVARLLGAESPASLLNSLAYVGKRRMSNLLAPKRSDKPAGMGNLSYSCYQNSVLQGLASLVPMREYLGEIIADGSSGLARLRITEALARLVDDLYNPANNGATLWTPPVLKKLNTFQQQDAQEYYSELLDGVRKRLPLGSKSRRRWPPPRLRPARTPACAPRSPRFPACEARAISCAGATRGAAFAPRSSRSPQAPRRRGRVGRVGAAPAPRKRTGRRPQRRPVCVCRRVRNTH